MREKWRIMCVSNSRFQFQTYNPRPPRAIRCPALTYWTGSLTACCACCFCPCCPFLGPQEPAGGPGR